MISSILLHSNRVITLLMRPIEKIGQHTMSQDLKEDLMFTDHSTPTTTGNHQMKTCSFLTSNTMRDFPQLPEHHHSIRGNKPDSENKGSNPFLSLMEMISEMDQKFSHQISSLQTSLCNMVPPFPLQGQPNQYFPTQLPGHQMGFLPQASGLTTKGHPQQLAQQSAAINNS